MGGEEDNELSGLIIPPNTWRYIGKAEPPERFIPLPPGSRASVALLRATAERMGFNQDSTEADD